MATAPTINDPYVVYLTYHLLDSDAVDFSNSPDVTFRTPDFEVRLSNGILTLSPLRHFATELEARSVADKFVKSWEIQDGLQSGRADFRLFFHASMVAERDRQAVPYVMRGYVQFLVVEGDRIKCNRHEYPPAPTDFRVTPEVEVLWERFCRYVAKEEPLLSMAYFCLTLLERGQRRQAAKHFRISVSVLKRLGELTSTRGDNLTARKFAEDPHHPLSDSEAAWVVAAIKAIIKHLATAGPDNVLTMADLPSP